MDSETDPVFIIAEAGVNHNGSVDLAFQLVDAAVDAGADAVKFQTFRADRLVTEDARKADYQQAATGAEESQYAMLKRLELPYAVHHELNAYCRKRGVRFLSTAFDSDSLRFLVDDMGVSTLKIASGEITNGPMLLEYARTGCDLILSTGMATLGEVEEALGVLAFGFLNGVDADKMPSSVAMQEAYASTEGQRLLQRKATLLHCTTEYPAPPNEINLNAMFTLRNAFGLPVGYSDHSEGATASIAATAMGATVIEKHFTLDRELPGPDHRASLDPVGLTQMVAALRSVEEMMGSGVKMPTPSEMNNRQVARKSVVAAEDIQPGELFSENNLDVKRPGDGISPMRYWQLLGKRADKRFAKESRIS